jgi:ribosomal protein S18 acetylase RimI-like enzyme
METLDIQPVEAERADDLRATLALAFSTDPCTRYIWPTPGAFLKGYPRLLMAIGGENLENSACFATADFGAASLWLKPGATADGDAIAALIGETVNPERQAVGAQVGELMDKFHPEEPHWYLSMIGVDPARQGRGLGSALLKHTLAIVDAEGAAAYLESSNPKNVPLYERHGFEVLGEIAPADFPGLTPMLRRPQR